MNLLTIAVGMLIDPEKAYRIHCGSAAREKIGSGRGGCRNCTLHAWHSSSRIESSFREVCCLQLMSLTRPMIYARWVGRYLDTTAPRQKTP